jgi:hypothetical protein
MIKFIKDCWGYFVHGYWQNDPVPAPQAKPEPVKIPSDSEMYARFNSDGTLFVMADPDPENNNYIFLEIRMDGSYRVDGKPCTSYSEVGKATQKWYASYRSYQIKLAAKLREQQKNDNASGQSKG